MGRHCPITAAARLAGQGHAPSGRGRAQGDRGHCRGARGNERAVLPSGIVLWAGRRGAGKCTQGPSDNVTPSSLLRSPAVTTSGRSPCNRCSGPAGKGSRAKCCTPGCQGARRYTRTALWRARHRGAVRGDCRERRVTGGTPIKYRNCSFRIETRHRRPNPRFKREHTYMHTSLGENLPRDTY